MKWYYLVFCVSLILGFTACFESKESSNAVTTKKVIIFANKAEIIADSMDSIILNAIVLDQNSNEQIGEKTEFFKDERPFEGNVFSTTESGVYYFTAKVNNIVSNKIKIIALNKKPKVVIISTTRTTIYSDGIDTSVFLHKVYNENTEEINANGIEYFVNNKKISENKFATTTEGSYKITAKYLDVVSNSITITATKPAIVVSTESAVTTGVVTTIRLSAETTTIVANGKDKAILKIVGITKEGKEVALTNVGYYLDAVKLKDNTYTTEISGEYGFVAKYGEISSNEVKITAEKVSPSAIVLKVDKTVVFPNGTDSINLTAEVRDQKGEKMNAEGIRFYSGESLISGNIFTTTNASVFVVKAKLNDLESNKIEIRTASVIDFSKIGIKGSITGSAIKNCNDFSSINGNIICAVGAGLEIYNSSDMSFIKRVPYDSEVRQIEVSGENIFTVNDNKITLLKMTTEGNISINKTIETTEKIFGIKIKGSEYIILFENKIMVGNIEGFEVAKLKSIDGIKGAVDAVITEGAIYFALGSQGVAVVTTTGILMESSFNIYKTISTDGVIKNIKMKNKMLYTASASVGVECFDISDINKVTKSGISTDGYAVDIEITGDRIYLADMEGGVKIFDITETKTPKLISRIVTPGLAKKVYVKDGKLNVAMGANGWQVIDVLDINKPSVIKNIGAPYVCLNISGNSKTAYASTYGNGIDIIDLTENKISKNIETSGLSMKTIQQGEALFSANGEYGITIINEKNGNVIGNIQTSGYCYDLIAQENYLYVACGDKGVNIYDISNINIIKLVGNIPTIGYTISLKIAGNYLYIAEGYNGIKIVDITDKTNIKTIANVNSLGFVQNIEIENNFLYSASGKAGIEIFDITDKKNISKIETITESFKSNYVYCYGENAITLSENQAETESYIKIYIKDTNNKLVVSREIKLSGGAKSIAIIGNKVYVAAGTNGITVLSE